MSALLGRVHVNSSRAIIFSSRFRITRSGLDPSPTETITSAGSVVPFTWKFGRSAKTSVELVAKLLIVEREKEREREFLSVIELS